MAGIYIHIPYCRKACHYCNFHFSTSLQTKNEFLDALLKEIEMRKGFFQDGVVETVYFGGGTPSLLESAELTAIMHKLSEVFDLSEVAEITLEANPDDITADKVLMWQSLGVNRLSIGIQSFFEEDLVWMNRAHNAEQALQCIRIAQENGINNLTIDLIYGTPSLTDEKWLANMKTAFEYNVQHLSCYALTVEPKTALDVLIRKNQREDIDPDKQARHFAMLMEAAASEGYEHYEISNFAKPLFRSRHNSSYWSGAHYLGLGPSAHSFDGYRRQWNVSNNALYIKSLNSGAISHDTEILSLRDRANEYIMTSLRTVEGLDLNRFSSEFGSENIAYILSQSSKHIAIGRLQQIDQRLVLTNEGRFFADGIASDLFLEKRDG